MRFISRIISLLSLQLSKTIGVLSHDFICSIEILRKRIFSLSITAYILSNLFLIGFSLAIFELGYQYDQTSTLKATATFIISSILALISGILLFYIFYSNINSIRTTQKAKSSQSTSQQTTINQALSQLILEFAKDLEFKRNLSQTRMQNFKRSSTPFDNNSNTTSNSPYLEPSIKEAEEESWAE
jgi:hypothetical protein